MAGAMGFRGCSMRELAAAAVALVMGLPAGHALAGDFLDVLPPAAYDPAVTTLTRSAGFGWGDEMSDAEQVVRYARELASSAPAKVRLVEYARSLEDRPLVLLMIGSPANLRRLDRIVADLARLGDPRTLEAGSADKLIRELPAVTWIECSVHGDEASGADAGTALAYVLAAGDSPEVRAILDGTIVVVDPVENPDGRARFIGANRRARGVKPDAEPSSAEHVQPWPGGRFSHDLFDLNRDWFVLSHPETRGRVAAMLRYHPTVVADLHEMGAEMGYYFAPPAPPRHPLLTDEQAALLDVLGRGNAAAFDAHGWRYWTREVFDAFYPGYGDSWPAFNGAAGMTFEQGSSRGLVTALDDGTRLTYRDAVQHHLVAAFTTCRTVAAQRERFLRGWFDYRQGAVAEGQKGPIVAYAVDGGRGGAELADQLAGQGVEAFRVKGGSQALPAGSYVVPLAQPLGRLARALLQSGASMGEPFEKEQERRDSKRLEDEIYDLTAWSLPLLWNTAARPLTALPHGVELVAVKPGELPEGAVEGEGKVAFVLPWTGIESARALSRLLVQQVKVGVAAKPFTLGQRSFARGAVVVRRSGNGPDLRERLAAIARETGASFVGADTGYADSGIDLGSTNVFALKPPRVALAWDTPTSPVSAGDLRWAMERELGYPVSVVRTASLAHADLSHFDVVVLPDSWGRAGSYGAILGEQGADRLASWVREGGVLIAVGSAATFLAGEKVKLLDTKLEKRGGEPEEAKAKAPAAAPAAGGGDRSFDYEDAIKPADEEPPLVPGAILRVELDGESCLAAGFPQGAVDALVASRRIFAPLKLDKGENVGVYAAADTLVQSGFVLAASRQQLPRKAFLMLESHGHGKVVAFAEDPAERGLTRATMLLFANAVFFGPAY